MIRKAWVRNLIIFLIVAFFITLVLLMRQVLAPLFIALTIAYVGDPLVDRLEKLKIPRTWGIVILIGVMCLVLFGISAYLVPKLAGQVRSLAEKLPTYWETAEKKWEEVMIDQDSAIKGFLDNHAEEVETFKQDAANWLKTHAGTLLKSFGTAITASFKSIGAFFANLLGLVIIPVLAFYLLRDFDIMNAKIAALIPIKRRSFVISLFREIDAALGNFIKGQLLVALILSIIYSIGLKIAGCPAFLLIGVLAGFANLIPYLGLILGLVPAVLLTYLSGNPTWQILTAGLTFVVGQMLEGMVITPKVVGETVGLHPVMVLVSLTVAGTYFGFLGMILALPACAVLMVLLRRAYIFYINSMLYHDGAADTVDASLRSVPETGRADQVQTGKQSKGTEMKPADDKTPEKVSSTPKKLEQMVDVPPIQSKRNPPAVAPPAASPEPDEMVDPPPIQTKANPPVQMRPTPKKKSPRKPTTRKSATKTPKRATAKATPRKTTPKTATPSKVKPKNNRAKPNQSEKD